MTKAKAKGTGKAPAFQWYPGDHRRDTAVQACSFEARALWREMLDLMHDGSPRGYLTAGGVAIDAEQLARLVGQPLAKVKRWLQELGDRKVYSVTAEGLICSRRMVRDEHISQVRRDAGHLGGNPELVKQTDNQNGSKRPSKSQPLQLQSAVATSTADTARESSGQRTAPGWRVLEKSGSPGETARAIPPAADFDARADGFDAEVQAGRRSAADLLEPTSRTVRRFWQSHYTLRSTPAERQLDTAEQLRQLHDGRPVRGPDGQYVRAYGLDRLDRKCQQILDTTLRDPDAALGYLLIALGDTSDVSRAGELPGQVEAAAFTADDVDRSGDDFPTSIGDLVQQFVPHHAAHDPEEG